MTTQSHAPASVQQNDKCVTDRVLFVPLLLLAATVFAYFPAILRPLVFIDDWILLTDINTFINILKADGRFLFAFLVNLFAHFDPTKTPFYHITTAVLLVVFCAYIYHVLIKTTKAPKIVALATVTMFLFCIPLSSAILYTYNVLVPIFCITAAIAFVLFKKFYFSKKYLLLSIPLLLLLSINFYSLLYTCIFLALATIDYFIENNNLKTREDVTYLISAISITYFSFFIMFVIIKAMPNLIPTDHSTFRGAEISISNMIVDFPKRIVSFYVNQIGHVFSGFYFLLKSQNTLANTILKLIVVTFLTVTTVASSIMLLTNKKMIFKTLVFFILLWIVTPLSLLNYEYALAHRYRIAFSLMILFFVIYATYFLFKFLQNKYPSKKTPINYSLCAYLTTICAIYLFATKSAFSNVVNRYHQEYTFLTEQTAQLHKKNISKINIIIDSTASRGRGDFGDSPIIRTQDIFEKFREYSRKNGIFIIDANIINISKHTKPNPIIAPIPTYTFTYPNNKLSETGALHL